MTYEERNLAVLRQKFQNVKFDLAGSDYEAVETIGSGTYGVVSSAIQRSTGKRVAIKKIPNIFENCILAKRTLRELKILRHFHHDNIVAICDVLKPKQDEDSFCDVYLVMDLMETDLYQIIRSNQVLTDEHIRYFVYQITCGLKYIHSANVIHRDLKPSNLIVNGNCLLKIADFGMARCVSSNEGDRNLLMTWYVATRWYRAPELMLFKQKYTGAVDIWSLGCIVAELLGRQPIFPGRNFTNQIQLIFGILGSPNEEFVQMSHADRIKDFIRNFGQKDPVPLKQLYPTSHPKAIRLLEKMLKLNPKERISAVDILSDLYLNQYHDPSTEPVCPEPFTFDLDEQNLEACSLRQLIYKEITKREDSVGLLVSEHSSSSLSEHQKGSIVTTGTTRPDSTALVFSNEESKASLQHPVTNENDGQHSVVVDLNSLMEHFLAATSNSSNEQDILQHTRRKPFNMPPNCPTKVAVLPANCPAEAATLPPNCPVKPSVVATYTTKLESTSVQNAKTISDFQSKKLDNSDLLPNSKSCESQTKSISRSNRKNDHRKTNLTGGEIYRGGAGSRRGRGGRPKNVIKSLKPVSLFNELGERIDVKAVLKDSILSGQQNGELRRFANQIPVEEKLPSKLNQTVVHLSEDDKVLLKRWSEMQRAAAAMVPVASVTKKTKDPATATDKPVFVPIATAAPTITHTITTLPSELLPPENWVRTEARFGHETCKYYSEEKGTNASSDVPMTWSPSVQLSSGEIRSVLDMPGDLPGDAKPVSSGDINTVCDTKAKFPCDNYNVLNSETIVAGDRCAVLDVHRDSASKTGKVGDANGGSLDRTVLASRHQCLPKGESTKPAAQSNNESHFSMLDYSIQILENALSLHDISPESFKFVSSGCGERTEAKMWISAEQNSLQTDCTLWNRRTPLVTGSDFQLSTKDCSSGDNLSPMLSSGKLSLSGYGIGMDLEAIFPEEFSNLSCEQERPKTSASFLSDWLGVSDPLVTSDVEDVLNIISDM